MPWESFSMYLWHILGSFTDIVESKRSLCFGKRISLSPFELFRIAEILSIQMIYCVAITDILYKDDHHHMFGASSEDTRGILCL